MQHLSKSGSDRAREKRLLERAEGGGTRDPMPEEKRQKVPALSSVIVEAVKMDSLQKLCSTLEPLLRRVVGEEVERAIAKLVPNRLGGRTPPRQLQGSTSSNLCLQFKNKLALPLFTGSKVEGESGSPILVVLQDAVTGQVVTTGLESTAKLEVVVLDGDFGNDDEDWTEEDFENHVVKEREGKRPLLTGDSSITLKEGVGTLGELTFTDNSSWIRSRKFRLGVRVASGFSARMRIRECRTDAFTVKDHRGELYKKHYPPALNDEVWRLDKIGKDGAFHRRLDKNGIRTVEQFLRALVWDRQNLRHILGSGMSNKMWEGTVEHAKTCVLSGKLYVFYPDSQQKIGVVFNNICELMGVSYESDYKSVDSLTESQKVYVDKFVKVAYDNWSRVTEYDGEALVSRKFHQAGGIYGQIDGPKSGGSLSGVKEQPSMYNQQIALSSQPTHFVSSAILSGTDGGTALPYEYRSETSTRCPNQDPLTQSSQMFSIGNDQSSQDPSSIRQQQFFSGNETSMTGLALGSSQSIIYRPFGAQSVSSSHQASEAGPLDWPPGQLQDLLMPAGQDQYFTEEDIRAKSRELLASEDMVQQLFTMPSPLFHTEDGYVFSEFTPSRNASFGEDRTRASGKAYVGWLKLKAALRWGIFIRKIAAEKAEKRAQLEELED